MSNIEPAFSEFNIKRLSSIKLDTADGAIGRIKYTHALLIFRFDEVGKVYFSLICLRFIRTLPAFSCIDGLNEIEIFIVTMNLRFISI